MLIQRDHLPNVIGGGNSPVLLAGGRSIQKAGAEQFTQLPRTTEALATALSALCRNPRLRSAGDG